MEPRIVTPDGRSGRWAAARRMLSAAWWRTAHRWVLLVAVGMIVAQLAFRSWASFNGWFQFDDIAFASRVLSEPFGWHMLFDSHNSHLMPGGFLVTWVNFAVAPWTYWPFAAEMMLVQLLADIGAVVFLVSAFGRRPGILPPLAIFLATIFTLPSDIWWAVGVNQLPTVAAFFWAGWTHLRYLRTGRLRWTVATTIITILALAFQERALLLFVLYLFLPLAYFSEGDILQRVKSVVRRYRAGVLLLSAVAIGYVVLYASTALQFDPGTSQDQPLVPLLSEMGLRAVVPGLFGGPFRWALFSLSFDFPAPPEILVWPAAALLAYLGYTISKSRVNARRAWWLLGVTFAAQVLLVSASRSFLVGPQIGRDYRYTTEIGPLAALALAFAVMPVLGALERTGIRRPSAFLDRPFRVVVAVAAIVACATYSSIGYAHAWHRDKVSRTYFTNVATDLTAAKDRVPLIDTPLPDRVFPGWGVAFPMNMSSHTFKAWDAHTSFPTVVNDSLHIAAEDGHIQPVLIKPVRHAQPSDRADCPYPLKHGRVTIPLDGPVLGITWWVRATYYAEDPVDIAITAGDLHHDIKALGGLHSLFFTAQGNGFDSIRITSSEPDGQLCVSGLELGVPYAFGDQAPQ